MTDSTYAQDGKRLRSDPNSRYLVRLFAHIDSTHLFYSKEDHFSFPIKLPPLTDNATGNTPKISSNSRGLYYVLCMYGVSVSTKKKKKFRRSLCHAYQRSPLGADLRGIQISHSHPARARQNRAGQNALHAPRGDDLSSIWICYDRTQKGGEWIQEAFEQSEPWEYTPPLSLGAIVPKLKMLTSQKSRLAHVNRNRQKRSEACTAKLPAWASAAHHHWH